MKTALLKHRASRFLYGVFVFACLPFLTSCMSVYIRTEARNVQIPRVYPGTQTNIDNINEMRKTPPSKERKWV